MAKNPHVPQVGKEITKSSMGQHERREREQILKQSTVVSGKENTQPQVGKEISKSSMGQRARRERERILKQSTAPQTEQHLLRDTRTQPLHEINVGVPLDEHCANIVNNVGKWPVLLDFTMAHWHCANIVTKAI
ncbi:hypothetical protein RHGRI_033820 [Rhododendron griersonianum]|uniref:Uncharacterized protein n=1 Tax=Rhododendron griersonianum TaxID=479676 RepID=A0AAV6I0S7_9ERIC|nr:hypothetical protein RHGRI_033820 [Rhododendron griersonianum]